MVLLPILVALIVNAAACCYSRWQALLISTECGHSYMFLHHFSRKKNERSERFTKLELSTMSKSLTTAAVSVKVGIGNGIAFGLSCIDFGGGKGGRGIPLDPTSFQFFH